MVECNASLLKICRRYKAFSQAKRTATSAVQDPDCNNPSFLCNAHGTTNGCGSNMGAVSFAIRR